jgi:fucose permease
VLKKTFKQSFEPLCYITSQGEFIQSKKTFRYLLTLLLMLNPFFISPYPQTTGLLAIGHTLFAASRFLVAFVLIFIKPRWILLGLYLGAILFSTLSMTLSGYTSISMALLLYLASGGIFPIVFAICLRGMGEHTKTAASIMATAISGGAPFPIIQNAVAISHGDRYAFCVTVALFSVGVTFPIYLNLVPAAKKQIDPVKDEGLDHSPPP